MKSKLYGTSNSAASASATNYISLNSAFSGGWNSTAATRRSVIGTATTLSNLYVQLDTAPGVGKSADYTVYQNGSPTALTLTISGTNTTGTNTTDSVNFSPGDTINFARTPTGTPTSSTNSYWNMDAEATTAYPIIGNNGTVPSTSAANYGNIFSNNSSSAWQTTHTPAMTVIPTNGTLRSLYVLGDTAPGALKSYNLTLVINGTPSSVSASIIGIATTGLDIVNSVSVSAGDTVTILSTPSGTPASSRLSWGFTFVPDTDGESFIGLGGPQLPSTTSVQYEQTLGIGNNGWNSTESTRYTVPGDIFVKALYTVHGTAPGGSVSRIMTLRKAGADTSLLTTTTGASTTANDTVHTATFAQGDTMTFKSSVSGGTAAADTGGMHGSILIYYAPSGSTGQIKVWNGSTFVTKPVKVWNGSAWVTKPVKYWNGTSWVTTPY